MLHTHKSQSALEYLMTYGWAILIIVIVAVILYSMGIFNPSSSISVTITGFQKTPISSAIFTDNGGLSLSVQNSVGYPIKITNITATKLTGGKVTIEPNITLLPGKSQVLVLSKVFTAANQGSHISTAVTITYKEISQQLPGPYISTGSITGSTPTVIYPANYTFAAVSKLTITNKQSSATPSPFQQMVNITSADNGWQLISNGNFGQNVEFFYSNGTVIPSWLESYTGSNAIWWLKLGSIPASSSITVYMGIASTSTNLFNTVNDGEAPQLSPTYAEYDDGANVFNYYENFAGSGLPSGWQELTSSGDTYTWDNGISFTNNGNGDYVSIGTTSAVSPAGILELGITSGSDARPTIELATTDTQIEGTQPIYMYEDGYGQSYGMYSGDTQFEVLTTSFIDIGNSKTAYNAPIIEGIAWTATGSQLLEIVPNYNYNNMETVSESSTSNSLSTPLYIMLGQAASGSSSDTGSYTANWLRTRAYPPNGIMPTVSFGSIA